MKPFIFAALVLLVVLVIATPEPAPRHGPITPDTICCPVERTLP